MRNNSHERFRSSVNLDEMKKQHTYSLETAFPGITKGVIDKNLAFIELLNEYDGPSFIGIYSFLEEKGFRVESINMNNTNKKTYNDQIVNDVKSGKLYIGFKVFIENFDTPEQNILVYDVLAKKKNKIDFEKIKDSISDILSGKSFSSKGV